MRLWRRTFDVWLDLVAILIIALRAWYHCFLKVHFGLSQILNVLFEPLVLGFDD